MTRYSRRPGQEIEIEIRVAISPDGKWRILLNLPDAFVLLTATDARTIADDLVVAADDLVAAAAEIDGLEVAE